MRRYRAVVFLVLLAACGTTDEGASSTKSPVADLTSLAAVTTAPSSTTTTVPSTTTAPPTTTPPTTTTAAPTTSTAGDAMSELRADGLGTLEFGDSADEVMESLVALFGPSDSGEEYPYGAHPLRHVYWNNVGLAVVFSDYAFFRDDGVEHFAGWAHGSYVGDLAGSGYGEASWPLRTATMVGIDSSLADLQAAYGDELVLESSCDPGGPPTEAYVSGEVSSMRFYFRELPLGPGSQVVGMTAGAGPGC